MKKHLLALILAAGMGTLTAAQLINNTYYPMDKAPAELAASLLNGKDIEFKLEENATTGYVWSAVYDPRECKVKIEHEASKAKLLGAPGYAEIKIKPLKTGTHTVTLHYSRPFEPNAKPAKTVKCIITSADTRSAMLTSSVGNPLPAAQAPAGTPFLRDDALYRLKNLPAAMQTVLPVGKDIEFDLQENPSQGLYWTMGQYNTALCKVKFEHDNEKGLFKVPKAEIEIKALAPGNTFIDFQYGTGAQAKTLRVYVTVIGTVR